LAILGISGCHNLENHAPKTPQFLRDFGSKLKQATAAHHGARKIHRRDLRRGSLFRGQDPERLFSDPQPGPTVAPNQPASRGALGLPPLRELIDDTPRAPGDDSPYFPEERNQFSDPDIRAPGPDTANFPNSPYTLRQGRAYFEALPVVVSGPSQGTPATYNMEFLLRYGLTDRVELRLFSNGPTWQWGRPGTTNGFAPLAWDLKMNFWRENRKYWIPATGLEVAILTPTGTPGLNQGVQPIANLLFDWSLPADFMAEINVGFAGDPSLNNNFSTSLEPTVQWALQHELFEDFDLFFHGYLNGSAVPRYGDGIVLGGGAIWAINERVAVYGSYNAGVTLDSPTTMLLVGAALAF
jgi:hypothetical protein